VKRYSENGRQRKNTATPSPHQACPCWVQCHACYPSLCPVRRRPSGGDSPAATGAVRLRLMTLIGPLVSMARKVWGNSVGLELAGEVCGDKPTVGFPRILP
jgi:hypothetical protein